MVIFILQCLEPNDLRADSTVKVPSFVWLQTFSTWTIRTFFESKSSIIITLDVIIEEPHDRVHGPQGTYVKSKFFYGTVGAPAALLSLQDPHQHKVRRNIVNPLFSQGSVNALSEMAQQKIERAARIIERHQLENKPLDIQTLYRCISVWGSFFHEVRHDFHNLRDI